MKKTIRFVRSMSLLLALVLLFTMSPLSVIAVSGADAEETTAERVIRNPSIARNVIMKF